MKIRTMVLAAAALGLGPLTCLLTQASAQPLYDRIHVNMPYTVSVGHKTLPPGEYTIQQERSDQSNVLFIYDGNGMKFETSMMSNKALDNSPDGPDHTSIVLHHIGDDYYFDKIWVQGKSYGYEIPLPSSVKSREKELAAVTVPADASTTSGASTSTSDTTTSTTTTAAATDTANTASSTATASDNSQVAPPPVTADTSSQSTATMSQDTTTTQQPATPTTDTSATDTGSANREKQPATDNSSPSMPATSAGWLAMMLGGGSLSGLGMILRRKR